MRPFLLIRVLLLIIVFLPAGCSRGRDGYPYRWPAAGEPFDSLTAVLERQFNLYEPAESILTNIARLDQLSATGSEPSYRKMTGARAAYWRARYFGRMLMHDSAELYVRHALALNDSSSYPYDRMRMTTLLYLECDTIDGATRYRHFDEAMRFARKADDVPYEAHNAINMGNLMGMAEEYDKGLLWLRRADSLYTLAGYPDIVAKNGINIARLLSDSGRKREGDSILTALMENPVLRRDTFALNTVSRNLYASTKEKRYLNRAYDEIKDSPRYRDLRGLYRALLANHNYWEENMDSAVSYARLALEDLPYVRNPGHRAIIWFNAGLAWSLRERLDSALACRMRYEEYVDSAHLRQRAADVMRLNTLQEMKARETEFAASSYRRNMTFALIALFLAGAVAVTYLLLNRRNIRQRLDAARQELELEKTRRKVTATVLSVEEKDRMLTELRAEIAELRNEGHIKEENARRMEAAIKLHLAETANEETFREMFDVVNPHFTARLYGKCPGLADSYVRLACYILMGLDTKRVASLLSIRPESVRQSRWRLSQRLEVPPGVSLEDHLRALNAP